ncbi:MAG: chitobiase/beta-hexosaminidase C-terminal domain-containing protein, partial [Spirochaetales bacterium]|nr:chitobiase/beta-hexosaminidase C-terminal domain-containing protein [Spirochaetales bacterium]
MLRHLGIYVFAALLLISPVGVFSQSVITVSVPPGSYPADQRVALRAGEEEEIYYSFAESRYPKFVEYLFPFTLSAIEGEERVYTLRVEARVNGETVRKKEFSYVIDKRPPLAPSVSIPEGTYGNPIAVSLLPFEPEDPDCSYYVCVNGCLGEDARLWTGAPIELPAENRGVVSHTIKAFAVDSAGNSSDLRVWTYTIDTSESVSSEGLQILSPVAGVFANRQYLVIRSSGYEWIKYSLGGEDPAVFGAEYRRPFLLNIDGVIRVRVAGKLRSTGEIRTSMVEFTVDEPDVDLIRLESGIHDKLLLIQLESRDILYYSLDDTPAARKALAYETPFKIDLVRNGLKYIAFRVIGETDIGNGIPESRYFFILDDRTPSQPEILFSHTPPLNEDTEVRILGPEDAAIHYTIDGTSPDRSSTEYRGPFALKLPEESKAGSLLIKAAGFGANGRKSLVSSSLVTFDRIAPAAPEITYLGRNAAGGITIGVKSEFGTRIIFEMTLDDTLPAEPGLSSYVSEEGYIELNVPYGMERIFAFRFAATDTAGNFSVPTDPFRVLVDKTPPDPPEFQLAAGSVKIVSPEEVYFTMTTDGSEPKMPDTGSDHYDGVIAVHPVDGELNQVKIKAIAVDRSGNASSVSPTFQLTDDRRTPWLPDYDGPRNGGIYKSAQKLVPKSPEDAPLVYYTFTTDGSEPPDPERNSSLLAGGVSFDGVDGERVTYRVKLKPFLREGALNGKAREFAFIIDLEPPELPVPGGIVNGASYSHAVFVLPPPVSADAVFVSIAADKDELVDPLGGKARRFTGPIRLDAEHGEEKAYRLLLAAVDDAGNTTANPETYRVTVDKKPPPKPVISGVPPAGLSRDNVVLTVLSPFPVYYEMSTDGSLPAVPASTSSRYGESLTLRGEANREIVYTIRFLAVDEVGNGSAQSVARFTVDRLKPQSAPAPQVQFAGDSTVSIAWPGTAENNIHYMVAADREVSLDSYHDYSGPFTIPYEENQESLVLAYYAKDKAGNRSELGSMSLDLPGRTAESLFSGVENGMLYNSRCTIKRAENQADVRYDVTTNGPIPARVSPFSAAMPETLSFDAAPGETLRFAVRAAVFKPGNSSPVKEQIVRFTIDKTPPPAPDIPGWREEMFFQNDFQVELQYAEGNAYISVNGGSYALYSGPITLKSLSGGIDRYVISAYAKDDAGNQSIRTHEWTAYIDRQVVYVSPNGNDLFDGSRSRPFRTLSAAIEESSSSERKTIYLAEGSYTLYERIALEGVLAIYGGFADGSWKETKASDTTNLVVAKELAANGTVLSIGNTANVSLNNLTVRSVSDSIGGTLIGQEGGNLEISNCRFLFDSCGPYPIYEQKAGEVTIKKGVFFVRDVNARGLLRISGSKFNMNESSVGYEDSAGDVELVTASRVGSLIMSASVLEPGTGRRTAGLRATSSSIELYGTRIDSGQGKTKAIALQLVECDLESDGVILIGNREAWISTCLDASFSSIHLKNAKIDARAARGAVALMAEGSDIQLESSRLRGLGGAEFMYLLDLSNCTGTMLNNMLSGSDTRDFIGIHARRSSLTLANNTMVIGKGTNISSGVLLTGSQDVRIVNNIIHGPFGHGIAIETDGVGRALKILHNAFDGWLAYLKTPGLTAKTIVEMNNADQV